MSLLQHVLSPFVRDFWVGRTFLHRAGPSSTLPYAPLTTDVELATLRSEDIDVILQSPDSDLRRRSAPLGPGVRRFGARINGELAGVCSFCFGDVYLRSGGFYELNQNEAELTDIFTSSCYRGRGIASALIRFSTERMHDEGFRTLYAKVWHSNTPSSRAFRVAGWKESCFFVRLYPRGTRGTWHMEWRQP
jgi:ribosomal protein S18 acetylase RimI-like enzyme